MEANRFQIGDFVLVKGKPTRVESLTKRKVGYHLKEGEDQMHYVRIFEVKPIEINDNVVHRLGFKLIKTPFGFSSDLNLGNYYITINTLSNHHNRNYFTHIDNEDHSSIGGCDVQYLHQLQQIVRLATGKEMEVTL